MNKIEIEIPVDKEVDWEASAKQKQIVLKDKQLTYEDVCNKLFEDGHYYTDEDGDLCFNDRGANISPNNAATKYQLECLIARNKLANVAKYLNNGWEPGRTSRGHFNAYVLYLTPNKDYIGYVNIHNCSQNNNVLFKSSELAQQAIQILGEETIKLALSPLY